MKGWILGGIDGIWVAKNDLVADGREHVHEIKEGYRAPSENIVQNHLNIALLNVFYYFNSRFRHIFSPKNSSSVRISSLKV